MLKARIEKMLLYYSIFAAAITACLANGLQKKMVIKRKISSTLGKYLRGHVFKTTTNTIDPQHCLADCWAENDRCQSFNFLVQLQKCELNEASNLTNPDDYIDRPWVVYLTNPTFGRQQRPEMERHTKNYTIDVCASNPCEHAESCVQDLELGYRCQQCHSKYHGPKCEEHMDPCSSNPCQYGGTCISTMTRLRCVCPFPFRGIYCNEVAGNYKFHLNGSGDYPYHRFDNSFQYSTFTLNFWFKTAEPNTSYFMHYTPKKSSDTERLAVWRNGNTFFVELWKDHVYNFTFPLSYPVNNDHWRLVTIVLHPDAKLNFYLDGIMRESPKLTKGIPGASNLYHFRAGTLRLGYFKDSNGDENFFNGSIGNVDIKKSSESYDSMTGSIVRRCVPGFHGYWEHVRWAGLRRLAQLIDCSKRAPIMGIYSYYFRDSPEWLEQQVSPPKDLTAFTLLFQTLTSTMFNKPAQVACYGNEGENCHLSVVINTNFTLGIVIESTRFNVEMLPINDNQVHFVIITWSSNGGVFELIIDGMLQSSMSGIETNGKISGQSRFILGSIYHQYLHNLNVWDRVLSYEMLYMMTAQPGDDVGNVVAWKDFKKPENIPDKDITFSQVFGNFRYNSIGRNKLQILFSEPFPAYIFWPKEGCCRRRYAITITMWLFIQRFPATLFSIEAGNDKDPPIVLTILSDGNIKLFFKGENASLGMIKLDSVNFLAFSWLHTGELHRNLNGVYKHISSNFVADGHYAYDWEGGGSIIGDRKNESILGIVSQFNFWFYALPPSALMALSRGANGFGSAHFSWSRYSPHSKGNTQLQNEVSFYIPDFIALKKRDQHCNDTMNEPCVGKYRARYGWNNAGLGRWGCFCEENLSEDMNFNYGDGNYTEHGNLVDIT